MTTTESSLLGGYLPSTPEIMQAARARAFLIKGLHAIYSGSYVCGSAMTCACHRGDNLALHYALMDARPGAVLVCDCAGRCDGGYFGELMAMDGANRGVNGIIINGSVRDSSDLEKLRFPTFCRGTAPASCAKQTAPSVGEVLSMLGVEVAPDDQIIADDDGIVLVRQADWPEVLERARLVRQREDEMRERLQQGETLCGMITLPERGEGSALTR